LDQQHVTVVMKVADDGHVAPRVQQPLLDLRYRRRRFRHIHRPANEFAPRFGQLQRLLQRRLHVRRVRVGHGLHDDGRAAAHHDAAHLHAKCLPARVPQRVGIKSRNLVQHIHSFYQTFRLSPLEGLGSSYYCGTPFRWRLSYSAPEARHRLAQCVSAGNANKPDVKHRRCDTSAWPGRLPLLGRSPPRAGQRGLVLAHPLPLPSPSHPQFASLIAASFFSTAMSLAPFTAMRTPVPSGYFGASSRIFITRCGSSHSRAAFIALSPRMNATRKHPWHGASHTIVRFLRFSLSDQPAFREYELHSCASTPFSFASPAMKR